MAYELGFEIPHKLEEQDRIALAHHLEREIKARLHCEEAEVIYLDKEEQGWCGY